MKKFLFISLICFLYAGFINAQSFQFYRVSTPVVIGDTSTFNATVTKAIFKNTSSAQQSFKFVRVVNNLPASDWSSSMCVGSYCYPSTADTVPPRGAPQVLLAPGALDTLFIDVIGRTPGTAKIVIQCYLTTNPSNFIVDTFRVQLKTSTSIRKISSEIKGFQLSQNYPNPFNPVTNISFSIPSRELVSLYVYDTRGTEVARLINNEQMNEGTYAIDFNTNTTGLSSGVYYYRLSTEKFTSVKKMILIK